MPRLSTHPPYFLHMSDLLHKNVNTETIYFMNDVIIFTCASIEDCHEIAEICIDGQD